MKKLIFIIVLFCVNLAFAQSPQKMSFQAVVRNSSNVLVANSYIGVKASILQGSATGTVIYSETNNATTNTNGLLTLEIGNGTAITGSFTAINWAAGPFFIKTEMDATGGTTYDIISTQQMMSVPYALYAEKSGSSNSSNTFSYFPVDAHDMQIVALTNLLTTPYTVPVGKKLYVITAKLTLSSTPTTFCGAVYAGTSGEVEIGSGLYNASFNITSNKNNTKVLGYLFDETKLISGTITVPAGKTLYVLVGNVSIDGVSINFNFDAFRGTMPLIINSGKTVSGFIGFLK